MNYAAFIRRRSGVLLSLTFCLLFCCSCGKSGMPSPKKTQDTFVIAGAGVSFLNDCLVAQGTVNGAAANLDRMTLEIAPIQSYDDCPGCPFAAQEHADYSTSDIQLDFETGKFAFSFCPSATAPMYRWRLIGKNIFLGLPHATTTPQVAISPASSAGK